jgi:2-polyprenyl-3-methyl-5-hydroxy-6-metoxy-1,4-benzoquinol methylase
MENFKLRPCCPSCRSKTLKLRYDVPYADPDLSGYLKRYYCPQGRPDFSRLDGEHYRLMECGACGLVFQDRVPNDAFLMELYEVWIDPPTKLHENHSDAARQFRAMRLIWRLIRRLGKPSGSIDVLDFGMGWGEWLFAARGFGCPVHGLELSPARIKYGRDNGITMLEGGDLSGRAFDLINCDQVLEHVEDPRGVLETMAGCLAPAGILRVSVPNLGPVGARLRSGRGVDWSGEPHTRQHANPTEAVTPLEHVNAFTGKSLRRLAAACGLKEIKFGPVEMVRTATFDKDSLKDIAAAALIRLGHVDRFTTVYLAPSR